jgi:hypothetical protein
MQWGWRISWAIVLLAGLGGCAREEVAVPRARLGALPFPGPFTLYVSSEVGELGGHRYEAPDGVLGLGEGARGIVYTCRAGFLDLAHLRESVDWTWYLRGHVVYLLEHGGGSVTFENDQTRFDLIVRPPRLEGLSGAERAAVLDEAAVRLGQRGAFLVETWHEIESWYGLRTVFFVPEDRSTFTWDDTASHAVGAGIGARVARVPRKEFDEKAAAAIREELESLGAVPKSWVDRATQRVAGRWWKGEVPVRRDLDIGLESGSKAPWIVPGLECCEGVEPIRLEVPSLRDVRGRDLTGMYEIRLTLWPSLAAEMYKGEEAPQAIDAEREFPRLVEKIRASMKERFGPECDRP